MKNIFISIILLVVFMSLAYAQVQISNPRDSNSVIISKPDAVTNFTLQNVNSSDFWDLLDTPSDISGNEYWYNFSEDSSILGDIFVNETGDTMTGNLLMDEASEVQFRSSTQKVYSPLANTLNVESPILRFAGTILSLGSGGAVSVLMTYDTSASDGIFGFIGNTNYFNFANDVLWSSDKRIFLRDTEINLSSTTNGKLRINADGEIEIVAPEIIFPILNLTNPSNITGAYDRFNYNMSNGSKDYVDANFYNKSANIDSDSYNITAYKMNAIDWTNLTDSLNLWTAEQTFENETVFEDEINVTDKIIFNEPTLNITTNQTCVMISGKTSILRIC